MATWVEPIESQTDPDAPLTSDLAKQWSNNVIAAFDGEAGAPRLAVRTASGGVQNGNLNFTGLEGYQGAIVHLSFNDREFTLSLSDDGISYGAETTLITRPGDGINGFGVLSIDFVTGAYRIVNTSSSNSSETQTGVVAGGSIDVTAFRLSNFGLGVNGRLNALVTLNGGEAAS